MFSRKILAKIVVIILQLINSTKKKSFQSSCNQFLAEERLSNSSSNQVQEEFILSYFKLECLPLIFELVEVPSSMNLDRSSG